MTVNAGTYSAMLEENIRTRHVRVGVIGLGYVGLPLALAFSERGFHVTGFDVDASKIDAIGAGRDYIKHLGEGRVRTATESTRFEATTDFARLGEPDVVIACVPTPLTVHRDPDMSYIESSARAIGARLRLGQLVILESTTYPGTTDELVRGILESSSGLRAGEDFYLAYSPEREDPGNPNYGTTSIPKVIGGYDPKSGDIAQLLYDQIMSKTVRVSNCRVAEATKLAENVFRAINIALVNEMKIVHDRMGIDIWEVLDAASTKPFGFMRFDPGPGWGGHCIPLDPFYLSWKAKAFGVSARFIELAGEINVAMPVFVVSKLFRGLNERGKAARGSSVLVLGLAYKKDIDDPRESPSFELIDQLLQYGVDVSYHDPHIPVAPRMRSWPSLPPMQSVPLTTEALRGVDAVLIATNHSDVDYAMVQREASLVVDTRGVFRADFDNVVRA